MRYILLPLAIFASTSLSAVSAESTAVYLPIRAVPDSLDPSNLKVDSASYIFRQVAEGLFAIGEGFQIYPRLAESTEWSTNQRKLTIHLRSAKFSDGSPVDAPAVVQSLTYCIRNAEKTLLVAVRAIEGYDRFAQKKARELSGIHIKSPTEIEIRLSRQAPLLLDDLAQADCHIVKPGPNGTMDLLKGALGSGPYQIKAVSQTEIVLERAKYYYTSINGPEVGIFRQTSDFGRFDRLKSWVTMAALEYQPEPDSAFNEVESSELGSHQLIFNNSKKPFNRADVRRAVALALDYGMLAAKTGWSADTLQAGLVPLGMAGFRKRELGDRDAQIAEANQLLKRAGFSEKHPLKFTLLLSRLPAYQKEAELWPKLFHGAPIQAQVELLDHTARNARLDRGDFQAMRVMKFAGSVEAHRVLSSYLSGSTYNPTRSHEPECDRLTSAAISTTDREDRLKLYEKADRCLVDRTILVPLASIQPGYVLLKKPWQLSRTNRYLLYPYWISEWRQDGQK
jgi:oligopeptide transport system substrate-binding protein